MKWRLRSFGCILAFLTIASCQAVGESPQTTAPVDINSMIETPSLTAEPLSFPQMTGTAQAIPTVAFVIEPTWTPAIPGAGGPVVLSPNGLYAIACTDPFFILFNTKTKAIISTFGFFPVDCESDIHWASDSSYVFFGMLYRWPVNGSQPELVDIHVGVDPNDHVCSTVPLYKWSPGAEYLVVRKCGITVVVQPFEASSLATPLLISDCCVEDFRWATSNLLMIDYSKAYSFVHIPTGEDLGSWSSGGGVGCAGQPPFISPDELWVVFDQCWAGGGVPFYDQYALANMKQGSVDIFSEVAGDRIEFINWKPDGSEFYMVSRPTKPDAEADPRTPFGLLALNPRTLQVRNLFEQAWYISFNKDFLWAYVVFPGRNANGNFGLDGGLWQVGTSELVGKQLMAIQIEEKFWNPYNSRDTGSMYSATGKELGFSSDTLNRPLPAVWSHDNRRVATIDADHQLIVIDVQGTMQPIAQLNDDQEWLYSEITWSDDDRSITVDNVTWVLPQ
jgi:hypothetical protein